METDIIIDKNLVLTMDLQALQEILLKEDSEGNRYRERIFDEIDKIGLVEWFKLRGLPTNEDSMWKNRYCGDTETLGEYMKASRGWAERYNKDRLDKVEVPIVEIYLWENYLPIEIWNDKEMFEEYKNKTEQERLF